MRVQCAPLYEGDTAGGRGFCGYWYNDEDRSKVCPHVSLSGGDNDGLPGSEAARVMWLEAHARAAAQRTPPSEQQGIDIPILLDGPGPETPVQDEAPDPGPFPGMRVMSLADLFGSVKPGVPTPPAPEEKRPRVDVMAELLDDVKALNAMVESHAEVLERIGIPMELRAQMLAGLTSALLHAVIVHR